MNHLRITLFVAATVAVAAIPAAWAFAAPFIVCDPAIEGESVTGYVLTINGVDEDVDAPLRYDCAGLPDGNHDVTARAKNAWGTSEPSVALNFTKALPSQPSAVGLSAH